MDEDPTQSQQQLAQTLNVTRGAIRQRLKAMGKIHKYGKWTRWTWQSYPTTANAPSHTAKVAKNILKALNWGNIIAPAVLSRPRPVRLSPFRIHGTLTRRAALRQF